MKRITDHLSKEVVTIAEGGIAGIVTNAYVSEKLARVKGWIISSDEKEEAGLAELRRIAGYEDALTLPSAIHIREGSVFPCPLGAKTFDSEGRFLGVFRDLVFDEKSGKTASVVTDKSEFSPSLVIAASEKAVVLRAEAHASKTFKRVGAKKGANASGKTKSKAKPALEEFIASASEDGKAKSDLLPEEKESTPAAEISNNSHISEENEKKSISGEYAFLIGRKALKDLSFGGGITVKKGEIVSKTVLGAARASGKLVELTVNSKRV